MHDDLRPLNYWYTHKPGPVCHEYQQHTHLADGSIYVPPGLEPPEKPGMYQSTSEGCRALGCWMVIGAGIWATAIGLGIAVARRLLNLP